MKRGKSSPKIDAGAILAEVLREEAQPTEAAFTLLSEHPITLNPIKGHTILIYEYQPDTGAISCMFDTYGFADYMVERCAGLLDEYLADTTVRKPDGTTIRLNESPMSADVRHDMIRDLAHFAIRHFVRQLQNKLWHSLMIHEREILVLTRGLIETAFAKTLPVTPPKDNARARGKRLTEESKSVDVAFINGSLDRIAGKPDFAPLAEHYNRLRPIWKHARRIYKANAKLITWPKMVRAAYPDVEFPDDLLARIPGEPGTLPEELQAAVDRTDADARASHIAIKHAARLCNAPRYAKSVSAYFRLMRGPRRGTIETEGIN
jgi:hypothetical protein